MKRRYDGTYWVLSGPEIRDHPLVAKSKDGTSLGWIREHVYALYQKIGPGPHPCHYCGKVLEWATKGRGIQVDHVDDDRDNNDPANLVPSCIVCNTDRGRQSDRSEQGKMTNAREYTCKRCGKVCPSNASLRGHSTWCGEGRREKMSKAFTERERQKRESRGGGTLVWPSESTFNRCAVGSNPTRPTKETK